MFHGGVEPEDAHAQSGGAGAGKDSKFQEKFAKAVRIFEAYKDGDTFINRVNLEILRTMCQDHGLDTAGYKIDLLTRLREWVSWLLRYIRASLKCELSARRYHTQT